MTHGGVKRCTVAYALADAQWLWPLELPPGATVAEALEAARRQVAGMPEVPWESASVGIFGVVCAREFVFADGDRIEVYRPLTVDPRAARRERAAVAKRRGRAAS
jgi:putative ubiquitin-RnfH superfamily antitoxin RatB of RatAB toxin-antitoxin module